ncbi:MAG: hypothetical protein INQ03_11370 [Candidatus Heimdallarchaeota archaeon]|nr:hypothetical protein [Candidatus Heimdallarchaeota archaeon]
MNQTFLRRKILVFVLILMFFPMGTLSFEQKQVYFKDEDPSFSYEVVDINEPIVQSMDESNLGLDLGYWYDDAITIPMSEAEPYRRGSVEFELNDTYPSLFFKFDINDSSPVRVVIGAATGETVDTNQFEIYSEISNPNTEPIDFKSTFEFPLPFESIFPGSIVGDYYVVVSFWDMWDYDIFGDTVQLNVTIEHFQPGVAREGETSTTIQSFAHQTITGVEKYLSNNGYINYITDSVNLGEFNEDDDDFAKGIGLAVYGLLKSAEYMSLAGNQAIDPDKMVKYLNIAHNLYQALNNTMREPNDELFFIRPSETGGGNIVTYLSDNVYALLALGEISWFGNGYAGHPNLLFDPFVYGNDKANLLPRIISMFKVYTGDYREKITINSYSEDGDPSTFDFNDFNWVQYGYTAELDSLAVLAESDFWDGQQLEMDDIVLFIENHFKTTSISDVTLDPAGIYVDSVNVGVAETPDVFAISGEYARFVYQDDGGSFTDYSGEAQEPTDNDVILFPGASAVNDAAYFGAFAKFEEISFTSGTNGVGGAVAWEYWNGLQWKAIPDLTDGTSGLTDLLQTVDFLAQDNWVMNTVNGQLAYWVRARLNTAFSTSPDAAEVYLNNLDLTADIGDSVPLLPSNPATGNIIYFASEVKFDRISFEGENGIGIWETVWEYWDGGSWTLLSAFNDGTNAFTDLNGDLFLLLPGDWNTNNMFGTDMYILRARVSSFTSVTSIPLVNSIQLYNYNYEQSSTITSLGNALYISHIATYSKDTNEYVPNSVAVNVRDTLEHATSVSENLLRLFEVETIDGVLYSEIDSSNLDSSDKKINLIDNAMVVFALNRIAVNWEGENIPVDDTIRNALVRTWKIRSVSGITSIYDLLFDQLTGKLFPEYDDGAGKFDVDDNVMKTNQLVANLVYIGPLSDLFPVQMEMITQDDLEVFTEGQISLALSQISTAGTWVWWDPFKPFSIIATVTIADFSYRETLEVDLMNDWGQSDKLLINFFYPVEKRGDYDLKIDLSLEGKILLTRTIELRALGAPHVEFTQSNLEFSTEDDTFTGKLSFIDEVGLPLSNLRVAGALGDPIATSKSEFNEKYIKTARTDSSGKLSITFNTEDIIKDGIIDQDTIEAMDPIPDFIEIFMYLNVTNADAYNLPVLSYKVPVIVKLSKYYADFNSLDLGFSTDDTSFTGSITILNQEGVAVSNLAVEAALGGTLTASKAEFGNNYIRTGTTDASGKVSLTFNVSGVEDDLINRSLVVGQFTFLPMYINITSANNYNWAGEIEVGVRVQLSNVFLRISPTNLEITQGTTESFVFTVTSLNQEQEPITNARLQYSVLEIPEITNTVFSNNDGEATITLRDTDLSLLSNYAIVANRDKVDREISSVTIQITMSHPNFEGRTINKVLNILPNSLKITANPVQTSIKEKNILQSAVKPIEIEVAVEDLFSRVVNAYINIQWDDNATNSFVDLSEVEIHISPYTFTLDPSNLPAGEYTLLVIAQKEGITTTAEITTVSEETLGLSQDTVSIPVITHRTIIVETSTIEDVIITAISLFIALLLAQVTNVIKWFADKVKDKVKKEVKEEVDEVVEDIKDKFDDDDELPAKPADGESPPGEGSSDSL